MDIGNEQRLYMKKGELVTKKELLIAQIKMIDKELESVNNDLIKEIKSKGN